MARINKLIIVSPRGFCAGVSRAVKIVEDCLELFGRPIYVKHHIVHNKHVVTELDKKGAVFVNSLEDIPENSTAIFSAHGSPPEHFDQANKRNIKVIDATCPLVTKVHLKAKRFHREGYKIIYIGIPDHPEPIGVLGEVPEQIPFIANMNDVDNLNINQTDKMIYLTQTTLSIDDTKEIIDKLKQKFPALQDPPSEDICYATTNRQKAIKELAEKVDVIIVVGSKYSANSNKLVHVAKAAGKQAYLIDDVSEIKEEWFSECPVVGISSGASVPEKLVEQVGDYFKQKGAEIEHLEVLKEDMKFSDPKELAGARQDKRQK